MTSLSVLDLRANQLTGSLPKSIGRMSNLGELRFKSNRITGFLPPLPYAAYVNSWDLSFNYLSGSCAAKPSTFTIRGQLFQAMQRAPQLSVAAAQPGPVLLRLRLRPNTRTVLGQGSLLYLWA